MAENDALRVAMEEVTSVAEEIHKLHQQIKQYADSSKRMDVVSDALLELAKVVKQMEDKFAAALSKAEVTHQSVAELLKNVPGIVDRIESSDAAKSISEFTVALAETKELIEANKAIVDTLKVNVANEQEQQNKTIQEIGDKTDRLVEEVGQQFQLLQLIKVVTQNLAESAAGNTKAIAEIKTMLEEVGARSTESVNVSTRKLQKELALLKGEVESSKSIAEKSHQLIDAMSKKKGFLF
jgi:ABC-type transporter Mla subunit MlaD